MRPNLITAVTITLALVGASCAGEATVMAEEKLCEGEMTLEGSFTLESPQPEDIFGCWPVGTWTLRPTLNQSSCADAPGLLREYTFRVTWDEMLGQRYEYLTAPGHERLRMKVTSGGSGLCQGSFAVFSADGTEVVNLKPALYADQHIDGSGEYFRYVVDQWVAPE